MTIGPKLLKILACPICHAEVRPVEPEGGKPSLECQKCGRIYPIRGGIPCMMVDQASPPTRDGDDS